MNQTTETTEIPTETLRAELRARDARVRDAEQAAIAAVTERITRAESERRACEKAALAKAAGEAQSLYQSAADVEQARVRTALKLKLHELRAHRTRFAPRTDASGKFLAKGAAGVIETDTILESWLEEIETQETREANRWERLALGIVALAGASALERVDIPTDDISTPEDTLLLLRDAPFEVISGGKAYMLRNGSYISPAVMAEIGDQIRERVRNIETAAATSTFARASLGWQLGAWLVPAVGRLSIGELADHCPLPVADILPLVGVRLIYGWLAIERARDGLTSEMVGTLTRRMETFKMPIHVSDDALVLEAIRRRAPEDRPDLARWWQSALADAE